MMAMENNGASSFATEDDDSFLDWETRNETVPFWKHCVAGN